MRQRGIAILVVLTLLTLVVLAGLLANLPATDPRSRMAAESATALADARSSLVAWALSHPNRPGRLPLPDRNGDGNYDDRSDCVSTGLNDSHLLGRLPIRGEINSGGGTNCTSARTFGPETVGADATGERLWYAVSRHLVHDGSAMTPDFPIVVPSLLDDLNDWLTVTDRDGNVIDAQVAFVVIAPNVTVGAQTRSSAAPDADNFLDAVNDGTPQFAANYDDDRHFVRATNLVSLTGSDLFNDQLVFSSASDFLAPLIDYALSQTVTALQTFHTANGTFPDAAPADDGVCVAGTSDGRLPTAAGDCIGAVILPAWLDPAWVPEIGYTRNDPDLATLTILQNGLTRQVTP